MTALILFVALSATPPPEYVDEAKIPSMGIPTTQQEANKITEQMGAKWPHILVGGEKLDYNAKAKWYYYAGSTMKAYWQEYTDNNGKFIRELSRPHIWDEKQKKWFEIKGGKMVVSKDQSRRPPTNLPPLPKDD